MNTIDFIEAEQRRTDLSRQLAQGQITPEVFTASVNALRLTDSAGRIWQPSPSAMGWLCWNGTAWQAATPPETGQGSPPAQKSAKDFNEFKSSLMTMDEFKKVSKDVPLAKRPQRWWDLLSILGGVVGAILWFLYGSVRSGQEGFDFITPLLMIAIPVIMVWFRGDIDQILLPLQPHRKKISKIILIGLGIATPFLTAWLLYNIFHISEYPLMQANMVIGTFAAYSITRDPQVGNFLSRKGPVAGTAMVIFTIMLCSCVIAPALADDCERDPLNAQDCLRTDGYAEAMAGLVSAILGILINGPIILQGLLQGAAGAATAGAAGAGAGVQPPAPYNGPYVGDRREFTDHRGQRRSAVLQADGHWVSEDEGTWVDMDKLDNARKEYEEGQKWIRDQQVMESEKFIAQTDEYAKQLEAIKNYKSPEREAFEKWYRDYLELSQKTKEFSMNMHHNQANIMNGLTKAAEWTVEGADFGVDVLSNMTGPAGKGIKTAYTTIKDISKNVSASYANGEDLKDGLAKGVAEAAFDFAFDKAKDKFSKITQGKVPFFKNFKGGNFPDVPDDVISNALNRRAAQSILEQRIRNAAQGSMNKAVQGRIVKGMIKDPMKKFIGLK